MKTTVRFTSSSKNTFLFHYQLIRIFFWLVFMKTTAFNSWFLVSLFVASIEHMDVNSRKKNCPLRKKPDEQIWMPLYFTGNHSFFLIWHLAYKNLLLSSPSSPLLPPLPPHTPPPFTSQRTLSVIFWKLSKLQSHLKALATEASVMECVVFLLCWNAMSLLWTVLCFLCAGTRWVCSGLCSVSCVLERSGFVMECVVFLGYWDALSLLWSV